MILVLLVYSGHANRSFRLKGEEPPMCIACGERLTVEYIWLLFCFDFTEIKERHDSSWIRTYPGKTSFQENIFNFLKEINFWGGGGAECKLSDHILVLFVFDQLLKSV